ncbi:glycosyltransferase [Aureibacter tunicatorum]|uniref:Glycosyltransferase involved in cell wall biosynthesis n=1 Tax=Aureibacter tunicatorum TaxID=866807 RepID=A0AAE3XN06_9BACT|nr:glycosyltransferase [Aureibacter tunicatorum]MDR6239495.1 glycosyltransferase involved in cell wall biosynthesis [Aureibacter tunicatorum]BDD04585.1 glycosyl transferase [Aureibacter tunicatorum]
MHILIVDNIKIPVINYGAVERFVWWIGKELSNQGHEVSYLVKKGSYCPFGKVYTYDLNKPISVQIPKGVDVLHLNNPLDEDLDFPFLITCHGNYPFFEYHHENTVFVSQNHANRYNADTYVYIGLDFDEYGKVDWNASRDYNLFLANTENKKKNVKGAISICEKINQKLAIVGGDGNSNHLIQFKGMVGGFKKNKIINGGRALLFPVIWNEPFGVALIESLYFGLPVIGTPYGSLPELINEEVGYLSFDDWELESALLHADNFDRSLCHQYVLDEFDHITMTNKYISLYEKVLNGEKLNKRKPILFPNNINNLPIFKKSDYESI